jgi:hypothetical protein
MFMNRIVGTLDAQVRFGGDLRPGAPEGGPGLAEGWRFRAQLYAGPAGGALAPVGMAVAFREGVAAGYWDASASTREIPGVPPGGSATAQARAWVASLGSTYEEAAAKGIGGVGQSFPVTVTTGGGLMPPTAMVGLMAFEIAAIQG